MKVNTAYIAYNGEQNPYGIGSPCIVLRLQGCHLRCYVATLGNFCDTPEALDLNAKEEQPVTAIITQLKKLRELTGISLIMLTGGDPLARKTGELHELFKLATDEQFKFTVETSGTIDPTAFFEYPFVSFIVDYKLKSAGISGNHVPKFAQALRSHDYIKFVVYGLEDYEEMKKALPTIVGTEAVLTAGVYWNGPMTTTELFNRLKEDKLLGRIKLNFQAHKVITAVEAMPFELISTIQIPKEI